MPRSSSSIADAAQATLRNVNLLVEPPAVRRGQSVALRCEYQLDGAPLYSIKFYRGQLEFYRFTPGEYPHTKVFQYPGIKVDVSRVWNSPGSPPPTIPILSTYLNSVTLAGEQLERNPGAYT